MKRALLFGGLVLLISGCLLSLFVSVAILSIQNEVRNLLQAGQPQPGLRSIHCPSLLAIDETGRVQVEVANPSSQALEYQVSLQAQAFTLQDQPSIQSALIPAGKHLPFRWNIRPQRSGDYMIMVAASPAANPAQDTSQTSETLSFEGICGVRVMNLAPLSGRTVETLAVSGILAGGLLLTYWLYDRWRERKIKSPELNVDDA